jgi:hypothetical protein
LFDEMTSVAFDQFLAGSLSENDLMSRLASLIDLPVDTRLEEWTSQAVSHLENLGLIESHPSEGTR